MAIALADLHKKSKETYFLAKNYFC